MPPSKDTITDLLRSVKTPGAPAGLVKSGALVHVAACEGIVSIRLHLPDIDDDDTRGIIADAVAQTLVTKTRDDPIRSLRIDFVDRAGDVLFSATSSDQPTSNARPQEPRASAPGHPPTSAPGSHQPIGGLDASRAPTPQDSASGIPGVKHIIAVGAGKGGVGKSTVATNLAVGLARDGHAVGLLDGDIYGPSLPTMLALESMEQVVHEGLLQPYLVHGIKAITIGKLVDPEKPLIWRGPMAHGAFKQLSEQTNWGELDYLIIDLPPGTGDVPLTLAQQFRLTGAIIVCTPQKVAQDDAVRASRMFQQLGIEVLGIIENMSYFIGNDGIEYDIFGRGGAEQMAQRLGLPFLGNIPINMALRFNSDVGNPTANFDPATAGGDQLPTALGDVIKQIESQIALAAMRQGKSTPKLSIS